MAGMLNVDGRHATIVSLVLAFACLILPARAEVRIQDVRSEKGVTAWLVEDYSVPIIAIRFAFEGGSTQNPPGKEGLANLMTGLFDEGAGDLDVNAFQTALDDAGAEMRFSAGRDATYGSMRLLADQRGEAFKLLKLAINAPRFDAEPIARIRSQIAAGIEANAKDPETAAQQQFARAIYGDHPYARDDDGTSETLAAVTADDLRAFHKSIFARERLKVAVVGAIDAETLKGVLDDLFGSLPEKPSLKRIASIEPKLAQQVTVEYALPQTSIRLAYPGLDRDQPEFFAAVLMNHILGGGSFTSWLFDEVREKRGLVYGISSGLVNREYSASLAIGTATRPDRAQETLSVIRNVVRRMAEQGPTAAELEAAKKYLIGAYAINNLDSSGSIASTLIELQLGDLGIEYMDRREGIIDAVTLNDVKAAAKLLLTAEPAVLIVGPASQDGNGG